jgi:CheY-like chemotaxis protein
VIAAAEVGLGGFQVLRQIRQKPEFAGVPVVMLAGDGQTAQAQRAYGLGANSFFVKSLDFSNSADLFRSVQLLLTSRS